MTLSPWTRHPDLRRNAIWGLVEIVTSAAVLFLLYRLVLVRLGLQSLGIWSLVLAATSLVRLGDIGAANGIGRFVAIAFNRDQTARALDYIETAAVTTATLYAGISVVLYWPLCHLLPLVMAGSSVDVARTLLPYALLSFTLTNVNGTIAGSLMGLQRADLKSATTLVSLLIQFVLAAVLTRSHGLIGLAIAQISQNLFAVIVGWFLIIRQMNQPFRLPLSWNAPIFRELLGFGMKLQAASLLSFLYEPATKFVLSSVGGLGAVGVFELSQKLVQQVRQLVVGPTQILMPAFAKLHDQGGNEVAALYEKAVATSLLTGLPLMTLVAAASPIICWVLMGHIDDRFVVFTVLLSAGWFLNLLAAPAYVLGIGTGQVGWNIWGHVVTSLAGPGLGLAVGQVAGAIGVVASAAGMLAAGSLFSMIMNCSTQSCSPLPRRGALSESAKYLLRGKRARSVASAGSRLGSEDI